MPVFMKKLLLLLGVVLVLLLTSFTYHRLALQREKASLTPKGQLVAVNGHKMSVLVKGNGPQTLVFLSGAGTASPILDFKDVYDRLSKEYKIVVVERAGYGYSEDTSKSRDVSVILSETRQALAQAHVSGPYIVISHSMASLETLLWQENYSSEVKAVVGLDWAFPESYSHLKRYPQMLRLARLGSQLGLLRYLPSRLYIPNENLNSSDRRLYQDKGTGFSQEQWRHYATSFAKNQENIELAFYVAPHYLYHYQTKEVIRSIKDFIQETTN